MLVIPISVVEFNATMQRHNTLILPNLHDAWIFVFKIKLNLVGLPTEKKTNVQQRKLDPRHVAFTENVQECLTSRRFLFCY